ncbi:MAG: ParA family protein [Gammaproteobacteria bacterium]|nr:ParA family protein [Gammaproteobacteria bacterium]
MQKIVVLNPKGGAGKTTLATNLASYFASQGSEPLLMDYDNQGSSARWVEKRPTDLPPVRGLAAFKKDLRITRSWQLHIPVSSEVVVVDTPAGLDPRRSPEVMRGSDVFIVPVLPSDIDIHASTACLETLRKMQKAGLHRARIMVVANRVRPRSRFGDELRRMCDSLELPLIASLRDSQNYVMAAEQGMGIFDIPGRRASYDKRQWRLLTDCLDPAPAMEILPIASQA